jgi:hypothetical protein
MRAPRPDPVGGLTFLPPAPPEREWASSPSRRQPLRPYPLSQCPGEVLPCAALQVVCSGKAKGAHSGAWEELAWKRVIFLQLFLVLWEW